jgi:hypothetical protein
MAGGTVSSGTSSYSGVVTATGTAEETTFADRYGYVSVTNTGTTILYATANGVAPTASGAGSGIAVVPGATQVIANGLPTWFQSSTVIPAGSVIYPDGSGTPQNNTTKNGQPGKVQPFMSSLAGKVANPGTAVYILGTATTSTYTINGAG